jgi:carboxylesterase
MMNASYHRRSSRVPILDGAEPFSFDGEGDAGRTGVVISHGFTGTPQSMRAWAEHLAAAGYSVRLPLLPGHGTTWQEMNGTTWQDWYAEIRRSYEELAQRCDTVFACGLSLGGTLVTRLAEDLADQPSSKLAGLVLVNPAYATMRRDARLARYISRVVASRPEIGSDIKKAGVTELAYHRTPVRAFVSMLGLWKLAVTDLSKIKVPILFFHSSEDHVVDVLSGKLLHAGATSTTVREVSLDNSYHVATLDNDAEQIFTGSVEFIEQYAPSGVGDQRP